MPQNNYTNMIKNKVNLNYPNFFVIGAAKAGTTTLHKVLRQHPQIYMPFEKEPKFFSNDERYHKGLDWYSDTFFDGTAHFPARGEASPAYLYWGEKVIPRIKKVYASSQKDLKFIVIFRDPVQRAYSYYWQLRKTLKEDLVFEQALSEEAHRLTEHDEELRINGDMKYGYLKGGCYASQVEAFLHNFPREQFLFLLLDDIKADFNSTVRQIFAFLDVDTNIEIKPQAGNRAAMPRFSKLHNFFQKPSGPLHSVLKVFTHRLPHNLRYRLKRFLLEVNLREQRYSPMKLETERQLRNSFIEEIDRLEVLIGRDLSKWKPTRNLN